MADWYVAKTQLRSEKCAAFHLKNQGFGTFLPLYRKKCRHARKSYEVLAPLFPGYIFVQLDEKMSRWRSVNGTVGISHIVLAGNTPASVPEAVMFELFQRTNNQGIVMPCPPKLMPGDSLVVTSGVFEDCHGIFVEQIDDRRAALLLNLLGGNVRATFPLELIATN